MHFRLLYFPPHGLNNLFYCSNYMPSLPLFAFDYFCKSTKKLKMIKGHIQSHTKYPEVKSRIVFSFPAFSVVLDLVLFHGVIFITITRLFRFLLGTQQVTRPHGNLCGSQKA